jgi:hypothetical protein
LLDVDFSDLELDNQEEFSYKEEEDLYLDDEKTRILKMRRSKKRKA